MASKWSIASVSSVLGVGTASSAASVMSAASCGSVMSAASLGSIMSAASRGAVMAADVRSPDPVRRAALQGVTIAGLTVLALRWLLGRRSVN
jgi:hypothetical protein